MVFGFTTTTTTTTKAPSTSTTTTTTTRPPLIGVSNPIVEANIPPLIGTSTSTTTPAPITTTSTSTSTSTTTPAPITTTSTSTSTSTSTTTQRPTTTSTTTPEPRQSLEQREYESNLTGLPSKVSQEGGFMARIEYEIKNIDKLNTIANNTEQRWDAVLLIPYAIALKAIHEGSAE